MLTSLDDLRRVTVAHSLFAPTTLKRALHKIAFVQADPIRAPARAQDLILRHRVKNYCAGDLERRYSTLGIEEDFFINYGFVTRALQALMYPRADACVPAEDIRRSWPAERIRRAQMLLDFVQQRGAVHPRDVDEHFSHGSVKNDWGGSSSATTHLLEAMHYRGMLRVVRREAGVRIYAAHDHADGAIDPASCRARLDALIDAAVRIYAPLPAASLRFLVRRMRFAVPQWRRELRDALQRTSHRLSHARISGIDWYWPEEIERSAARRGPQDAVRLLTPFDPVVWDRARFQVLWGWTYRFEAYTPASKRKRGYYAMPLLWRDRVIGWGNLSGKESRLESEFGYIRSPPRERGFRHELEAELDRMCGFLNLGAESLSLARCLTSD